MHDRYYCPDYQLEPSEKMGQCCQCGRYICGDQGTVFKNGEFVCDSCQEEYIDLHADDYQEDYIEAHRDEFLEYVYQKLA